ncbi:MAG: transposase [Bacteroidota bacterium]
MPLKGRLTDSEKQRIVAGLANGLCVLDLAKELGRDRRTVESYVKRPNIEARKDKGKRRQISARDKRKLRRQLFREPNDTSASIFQKAGVAKMSRATRCSVLNEMAKNIKPISRPPLNETHKQKRLVWAQMYLKTHFEHVLFTDEARATLDGPDGWAKVWNPTGAKTPHRFRRQQGGGGVMFWAGIIGDELVGPFRVPEGVKLTSKSYINFLDDHLSQWLDDLPLLRRSKMIFMHDNAPSHSAKATTAYLASIGIKGKSLMTWPPCSPDLNPIEQLWSILKRKVYEGGQQYNSKDVLWRKVEEAARAIRPSEIKKLTESMDKRLFKVISNHGSYVDK